MRAIAKSLKNNEMRGLFDSRGRQIDIAKIQRWQKRQGRMNDVMDTFQGYSVAGRLHSSLKLY
jgi:hypothetical protein